MDKKTFLDDFSASFTKMVNVGYNYGTAKTTKATPLGTLTAITFPDSSSPSANILSTGAIIGIAIGVSICFCFMIIIALYFLWWVPRGKKIASTNHEEIAPIAIDQVEP